MIPKKYKSLILFMKSYLSQELYIKKNSKVRSIKKSKNRIKKKKKKIKVQILRSVSRMRISKNLTKFLEDLCYAKKNISN